MLETRKFIKDNILFILFNDLSWWSNSVSAEIFQAPHNIIGKLWNTWIVVDIKGEGVSPKNPMVVKRYQINLGQPLRSCLKKEYVYKLVEAKTLKWRKYSLLINDDKKCLPSYDCTLKMINVTCLLQFSKVCRPFYLNWDVLDKEVKCCQIISKWIHRSKCFVWFVLRASVD